MIDLKDFYFQNIQKEEYHYRFYSLIENINMTFNIFGGSEETNNYKGLEEIKCLCLNILL